MLVGLVGFAGSGKNAIGDILVRNHDFASDSFAKSLKDATAAIFGWDRALLEGDTPQSRHWRDQTDGFWAKKLGIKNFTPRMALQLHGTECCRHVFGEDLWIHTVVRRWENAGKLNTVISDCRFPNEIKAIRNLGGKVYRVDRGPLPPWYQLVLWVNKGMADEDDINELEQMRACGSVPHVSETAWIGEPVDDDIKNDESLGELELKINQLAVDDLGVAESQLSLI